MGLLQGASLPASFEVRWAVWLKRTTTTNFPWPVTSDESRPSALDMVVLVGDSESHRLVGNWGETPVANTRFGERAAIGRRTNRPSSWGNRGYIAVGKFGGEGFGIIG